MVRPSIRVTRPLLTLFAAETVVFPPGTVQNTYKQHEAFRSRVTWKMHCELLKGPFQLGDGALAFEDDFSSLSARSFFMAPKATFWNLLMQQIAATGMQQITIMVNATFLTVEIHHPNHAELSCNGVFAHSFLSILLCFVL